MVRHHLSIWEAEAEDQEFKASLGYRRPCLKKQRSPDYISTKSRTVSNSHNVIKDLISLVSGIIWIC